MVPFNNEREASAYAFYDISAITMTVTVCSQMRAEGAPVVGLARLVSEDEDDDDGEEQQQQP